jgi:uncharacterized protein
MARTLFGTGRGLTDAGPLHPSVNVLVAAAVLVAIVVLAACGPTVSSSGGPPRGWVDQPVGFRVGDMTVYGTFRHPSGRSARVPAALIIAGSGPTDRDGNSALASGRFESLKAVADWLSGDGVASLRYDKLGAGATGLGPYASKVSAIDLGVYEQEARAALNFLAGRPDVDDKRLAVIGHSEGALFALLLATGAAGSVLPVRALGLLEPLSQPYLDLISQQFDASVSLRVQAGEISRVQAAQASAAMSEAVASLRTTGVVQPDLPYGVSSVLPPSSARFLSEADRYDPAQLAAQLQPNLPVLLSCSDADIQVSCSEVDHLAGGLGRARAEADFVHLNGVDHVLKEDSSRDAADYIKPLPFSRQLQHALRAFAASRL